jgi:anti-anti-sigma factor
MANGARTNGANPQRDARHGRPHAQFGLDIDTRPGATTVIPHGELDALSAPVFAAVLEALSARAAKLVVIDLSDVRGCNVAGLRAMTELAARLHAVEGRVRINAHAVLDRMLELADLCSLFDLDEPRSFVEADVTHVTLPRRLANTNRAVRPRAGSPRRLATGT